MLAFFKKYRVEDGGPDLESRPDEGKRMATESAQLLQQNVLHRAERPAGQPAPPVRPPSSPPNGSPDGTSIRNRLQQVQNNPINRAPQDALPPRMPSLGAPSRDKKITLILDVDETLVHSSFKTTPQRSDLQIDIVVNGNPGVVFVKKRPYLKEFLDFVASRFEVVVFTASLSVYCNPLMDILDPEKKLGNLRLFREHCTKAPSGAYIKDLSLLGRPLERIAIVDNSPVAYYFQPRNAIPILSWFDDPNDHELLELLPLLAQLANVDSVYDLLDPYNAKLLANNAAQQPLQQ